LLGRDLAQLSVGVAIAGEQTQTVAARKLRPLPEACRVGTLVETVSDEPAERLAVAVTRALGYEGVCEVEILRDQSSGRMYLIEINARPWLQFALAAAAGRDLLAFLFDEGRSAEAPAGPSRVWLDFASDLWVCFGREAGLVRHGGLGWAGYLRSLLRANVYARWSLGDPNPFFRETMRLARQALTWASRIARAPTGDGHL
jgi:predicted ATP-grasp superfamily ATP-dependent carboligase